MDLFFCNYGGLYMTMHALNNNDKIFMFGAHFKSNAAVQNGE